MDSLRSSEATARRRSGNQSKRSGGVEWTFDVLVTTCFVYGVPSKLESRRAVTPDFLNVELFSEFDGDFSRVSPEPARVDSDRAVQQYGPPQSPQSSSPGSPGENEKQQP